MDFCGETDKIICPFCKKRTKNEIYYDKKRTATNFSDEWFGHSKCLNCENTTDRTIETPNSFKTNYADTYMAEVIRKFK